MEYINWEEINEVCPKGGTVFLYLSWGEDGISGYYCNGMMEKKTPFTDLSRAVTEVERHLNENDIFRIPIADSQMHDTGETFHYDSFYVLDILYRQYYNWQGILYGGSARKRSFKGVLELLSLLHSDWEQEKGRCSRKRNNGG